MMTGTSTTWGYLRWRKKIPMLVINNVDISHWLCRAMIIIFKCIPILKDEISLNSVLCSTSREIFPVFQEICFGFFSSSSDSFGARVQKEEKVVLRILAPSYLVVVVVGRWLGRRSTSVVRSCSMHVFATHRPLNGSDKLILSTYMAD